MENHSKQWWQSAVIYQIYPRSFYDSNGDGIGDLEGIAQKLDYLQTLGADAVWISPLCLSRTTNFWDPDPTLGTKEDLETLAVRAGERGIRVIVDAEGPPKGENTSSLLEIGRRQDRPYYYSIWHRNPADGTVGLTFQGEHELLDQQEGREKWDLAPLPLVKFKKVFTKWQQNLYGKGWNGLLWENYRQPRSVSRFGDDGRYRMQAAKMLGTLLFGMRGTPFLYQGEELGMANVKFDIEEYRDPELLAMYRERMAEGFDELDVMRSIYEKGSDNARTPMQWDDSPHAGFTAGTPWIRCNPDYTMVNAAEELVNQDSVFHYYQKLIRLRKKEKIFTEGGYEPLWEENENIFAYVRGTQEEELLVLCNFRGQEIPCPPMREWEEGEVLTANYDGHRAKGILRPYEAMIIKKRKEGFHA